MGLFFKMSSGLPQLMGILNVTPNSFSDGGRFLDVDAATAQAGVILTAGADIIDVGGESTGPGSVDVPVEEELARVMPVVVSLRATVRERSNPLTICQRLWDCFVGLRPPRNDIILSIDTYKSQVAAQALAAGAHMINDVTALRGDPNMAAVIAKTGAPIVLMYSKDPTARTTRVKKRYRDVMKTIADFFEERLTYAARAGIKKHQIILDPGMGAFVSGDPQYSFEILRRLGELKKFGLPILVGVSRKSFLPGAISERLTPTLLAGFVALQNGASILRVHDVAAHRALLQIPKLAY